ncbi:MAG: HPF/RaiA family ribosome-associated protein [Anaerolineae bacterium]|nr:HPF/RaiA family ribosome-associated protein [Anaerolineae bacterium]
MDELDFAIEFHTDALGELEERALFGEADTRLRERLAAGHDDITGAAITIRLPAHGTTPPLYEATVVVYVRPENVAAIKQADNPVAALKGALDAVERQVRSKREKLRQRWERPSGDPVIQEMIEVAAAESAPAEDLDITDLDQAEAARNEDNG